MEDSPWIAAAPDAPGTLKLGPPFIARAVVQGYGVAYEILCSYEAGPFEIEAEKTSVKF